MLVGALGLAAAISLVMWASHQDTTPTATQPSALFATPVLAEDTPRTAATTSGPPVVERAAPVELRVPRIALREPLVQLGLQDDGTVEVPDDPATAGWFRLGPPPGAPGSSVILGHVDSVDGPAVFHRLNEMRVGDEISVGLDDGSVVVFEVRSVRTYPNDEFPARRVYGRTGSRELNLVTCDGDYDAARGGYQANLVVNAHRR